MQCHAEKNYIADYFPEHRRKVNQEAIGTNMKYLKT
jgi:hypothetical protein